VKPYSITRRVVTLVLLVEVVAAIVVTTFAFFYERHSQFRYFDIVLRGRADTIMGAVEDADDANLGVMLDTRDLDMPRRDVYAVREEGAKQLGQSRNWHSEADIWNGKEGYFSQQINGHEYRGLRLHGARAVDPMAGNVSHSLTVTYASPTHEVWEGVFRSVQVFALANGLLILITVLLVPALIRKSMSPLRSLATEAGAVSATAWHFSPGDDVRQVGELRPLVEAMEGVIRRLEQSFTQQRQFVGDAAHELKTAVAVVKSSVQLLEIRARTPIEYEEGLKRCYADCLRMEELAQSMLLMARVEESGTPPSPTEHTHADLTMEARKAFEELAPFATLRNVGLATAGEDTALVGLAPDMLRSLLVNLLTNAIQHSPPEATVCLEIERQGTSMQFLVKDHGEGIPPEALPFVFDRFYRGDPSRSRKTGGTGLGLAICKAIVERAHGRISIESTPGSGTRVTVQLSSLS